MVARASDNDEGVLDDVIAALILARDRLTTLPRNRELALALTKIEEAEMWLQRDPRLGAGGAVEG